MALREAGISHEPWNKGLFDNPKDWMSRFNQKYNILENGCWEWTGKIEKSGYGRFWKNGKSVFAHRFAYEIFNGVIPEKLTVDHLCKNRKCVNPNHLDLATRHENARRGNNKIANNKSITHCPQGHEYDIINTYVKLNGERACKVCSKLRNKKIKLQQKIQRRLLKWP